MGAEALSYSGRVCLHPMPSAASLWSSCTHIQLSQALDFDGPANSKTPILSYSWDLGLRVLILTRGPFATEVLWE